MGIIALKKGKFHWSMQPQALDLMSLANGSKGRKGWEMLAIGAG